MRAAPCTGVRSDLSLRGDDQHRRCFAPVGGGANDDVAKNAGRDAGAIQTIAQRKRDPIAALVMHRAFLDRNNALRSLRRNGPSRRSRRRTATLLRNPDSRRRRNQRRNVNAKQPRQTLAVSSRAARHTERQAACNRRKRRSVCSSLRADFEQLHFETRASHSAESRRRRRGRRIPCRAEWSARACRRPSCRRSPCPSRESLGRRRAETRTARCDPSSCRTCWPRLSALLASYSQPV